MISYGKGVLHIEAVPVLTTKAEVAIGKGRVVFDHPAIPGTNTKVGVSVVELGHGEIVRGLLYRFEIETYVDIVVGSLPMRTACPLQLLCTYTSQDGRDRGVDLGFFRQVNGLQ